MNLIHVFLWTERNETYFQEFAEDLRRRKRSLFVQRPSGNSKDAMEAFDVLIVLINNLTLS